ncbi:MAG: ABC transporter permease [Phycisphaerae bacterium]|nr:ABC transporter permease [Phycisphaerae bacterium]
MRSPQGRVGCGCVAFLVLLALLGPLLANDEPIVCRHAGRWHFPGLVEAVHVLPGGSWLVEKSAPFRLPIFDAKRDLDPTAFALWPPVRFGPEEVSLNILQPPSRQHWLGTDDVGRAVVARLAHAAAASVRVGLGAMFVAGLIGVTIGGTAGYFGSWVDALLSRLIEIVICFPVFFLALGLMVWLEASITNVVLVIGLTRWTSIARYTRAEFIRLKHHDFVIAARASGAGPLRIMARHLLPNALAPILVSLSFGVAGAILIETGLSWLGFGVQPPTPSWGNMLRAAWEHMETAPHLLYPPCVAIFLAVLGFNLLGDAIREAADPTSRRQEATRQRGRCTAG